MMVGTGDWNGQTERANGTGGRRSNWNGPIGTVKLQSTTVSPARSLVVLVELLVVILATIASGCIVRSMFRAFRCICVGC